MPLPMFLPCLFPCLFHQGTAKMALTALGEAEKALAAADSAADDLTPVRSLPLNEATWQGVLLSMRHALRWCDDGTSGR